VSLFLGFTILFLKESIQGILKIIKVIKKLYKKFTKVQVKNVQTSVQRRLKKAILVSRKKSNLYNVF
jgi:hypothetical protein